MTEKLPVAIHEDGKRIVVAEAIVDVRDEGVYVNIEANPELDHVHSPRSFCCYSFGYGFFEEFAS